MIERVWAFVKRCSGHNISVFAAQASLFLIMSAFPFMIILLSLAQYVIPFSAEEIAQAISSVVPYVTHRSVEFVILEIFAKPTVSLISATAVVMVWSSSRGIAALMNGLEEVNDTDRNRGWLIKRIIAFFYTLVFAAAIIITLILLVMGNSIINTIARYIPHMGEVLKTFAFIKYLIPTVVLTCIFWAGYKFLPGRRERKIPNLPGAVFSTIGWIGFSYLFGIYVTHFSDYSYIYGSLTFVILLVLWTYFCMNIFLIGAELNCVIYEYKTLKNK